MSFTIIKPVVHEIKIKRSRFICYLFPVAEMESAKAKIRLISQQNQEASHNCWCYRLGKNGELEHASDAGEPAGTAGKPMLGQLKKADLSNVVAVVTRYFGGIKLGVSGLISAYGKVVKLAIDESITKEIFETKTYRIQTSYDFAEIFKYEMQNLAAKISDCSYKQFVQMEVHCKKEETKSLEIYLNEMEKTNKIKLLEK
jgi:uncharacterized YigZ family protein